MAAVKNHHPQQRPIRGSWSSPKRRQAFIIASVLLFFVLYPFWIVHVYSPHDPRADTTAASSSSSDALQSRGRSFAPQTRTVVARKTGGALADALKRTSVATGTTASPTNASSHLMKPGCLDPACIQQQGAYLARAFPDRTDQAWCIQPSNNETNNNNANKDDMGRWRGLLLVKVPKGASSTSAGVTIRIARRHNCKVFQWRHKLATEYNRRSSSSSFMYTTVRNPSARAISTIFFHVLSRTNQTATDSFLKLYLRQSDHAHTGAVSTGQGGFQLRYTALQEITEHSAWKETRRNVVMDPHRVLENVRRTIQGYDFLIVTERMDESLVAMSLLMGIDVGDVLVTASKVAGSRFHFAKFPHNVFKCLPTKKSFVSPGVQRFLDSDEWRAMNYGDLLLHSAVNASLDQTIDRLGRERFNNALAEYRRYRKLETEQCAPHVTFPCSNEGVAQPKRSKRSCYLPFYDFGCGYKCIDELLENDREKQAT